MKRFQLTKTRPDQAEMWIEIDDKGRPFVIMDDKRIAMRGKPGTPFAGRWIPLDPNYDVEGKEKIIVTRKESTIQ